MILVTFPLLILCVFSPLLGALVAGLAGKLIGRRVTHCVTIALVFVSFIAALCLMRIFAIDGMPAQDFDLYTWLQVGNLFIPVGFMLDGLSTMMMVVVTFVSLLVHIYSIGYMHDDDGYQRFFSYISAFTFAMLMLVGANNFIQLFFGWEGVGVISYLLIGFWYTKDSAVSGSLKAFLVNRVGDFGFLLGIAAIYYYFGSFNYKDVLPHADKLLSASFQLTETLSVNAATLVALLLFVGAMGKSAQVPLHVWLPESMEGPTPISALIHAATMVTAGIFMVSRVSAVYELSDVALNTVMIIGATGALFMGLIAIVQNDIKRVVAYSTLSQLGYMTVALGASAYPVAVFHLFTHAAFKALLFLGAGSVIIAMHHEQDMRKMGGLYRLMPITHITYLIGCLALCGIPPFAGFFSKESIIEAVKLSNLPGTSYAYYCVLIGVFVTAFYTFRSYFLTFHTKPRMSEKMLSHVHETPWVVWLPLVVLAVPSIVLGAIGIEPLLYAKDAYLNTSVVIADSHSALTTMASEFHGVVAMMIHATGTLPFWLALLGIAVAVVFYIVKPELPGKFASRFAWATYILENKFGFDALNDRLWVRGGQKLGQLLYRFGDRATIDDGVVNNLANVTQYASRKFRIIQNGYLYRYSFVMLLGLFALLLWVLAKTL